jgi:hypothetical protein
MITAPATTGQHRFSIGDFVWATGPDRVDRLAILADADHQERPADACRCGCATGTPSDQVTILSTGPAQDGINTSRVSSAQLAIAEPGSDDGPQARALTEALVARCIGDREEASRARDEAQRHATSLEETIASMRAYAIDRHRAGEICRGGLNEFLDAHDLPLYEPSYKATVEVSVCVEVHCGQDEYRDDLDQIVRDHITVGTDDSDRLYIDDFSIDYGAFSGIEEITDGIEEITG